MGTNLGLDQTGELIRNEATPTGVKETLTVGEILFGSKVPQDAAKLSLMAIFKELYPEVFDEDDVEEETDAQREKREAQNEFRKQILKAIAIEMVSIETEECGHKDNGVSPRIRKAVHRTLLRTQQDVNGILRSVKASTKLRDGFGYLGKELVNELPLRSSREFQLLADKLKGMTREEVTAFVETTDNEIRFEWFEYSEKCKNRLSLRSLDSTRAIALPSAGLVVWFPQLLVVEEDWIRAFPVGPNHFVITEYGDDGRFPVYTEAYGLPPFKANLGLLFD